MSPRFHLVYPTAADLAGHLRAQDCAGVLLLPFEDSQVKIKQFQHVELCVSFADGAPGSTLEAEVLQVVSGLGVAVALGDQAAAWTLAADADQPEPREVRQGSEAVEVDVPAPAPPEVRLELPSPGREQEPAPAREQAQDQDGKEEPPARDQGGKKEPPAHWVSRRKSGPLSWSFEMLQARWSELTVAEKARVAKWGNRPARGLIIKKPDRMLHAVLLSNPKLTPTEVATLAGRASLSPELLRRVALDRGWTRHLAVKRALICNPRMEVPQVDRLLKQLDLAELRRLHTSGKVRLVVKQALKKQINRLTVGRR